MVNEAIDALRRDEQAAGLKKEIGDEATGSALFSHGRYRGAYRGYGRYRGRGNYGGNKDCNDDKGYTCTDCKLNNHTTETCGILKRLNSRSRDDKICYYCGKPGHIRPECRTRRNGFEARNKVNKRNKDSKSDSRATLSEATASLAEHGIAAGDRDLF
jgi:hypothetical protein